MATPVVKGPTIFAPRQPTPPLESAHSHRPFDAKRGIGRDSPVARQAVRKRRKGASPTSSRADALVRVLYEQHAAPLLMFTLRLTGGDRQRAEDIVQETLLRAWRNAHKLGASGQASIRPWLVTVARRIAIDNHRIDSTRPDETYERELDSLAVADNTEQVLQSILVTEALRSLSYAHREILVETYFRGRTVPEAAMELSLPLGTAKSRIYHALRALRTVLAQRGVTSR